MYLPNTAPKLIIFLVSIITLPVNHIDAAVQSHGKFYGARATEYPAWFKESFLDFKADIDEANANGKRIMVLFYQDGCPYCNALVELNLSQKNIENMMQNNFDVIAINMWGNREVANIDGKTYTEKTFARAVKVQFTPTIVFFDETGKIILRLNGYLPPQRFKMALSYVAQHKEKDLSYREYVAANTQQTGKGKLHKQDFFSSAKNLKAVKNKPIAVFFEQKDCPNCNTLHTKVMSDEGVRNVVSQFYAVQLDMWSNEPVITPAGNETTAKEWAKALDVHYAPTIAVLDQGGKEVIRPEANFKTFHTEGILAYVLEGGYKQQPSFQRWLAARAEYRREQGRDVDIWRYADQKPGERIETITK